MKNYYSPEQVADIESRQLKKVTFGQGKRKDCEAIAFVFYPGTGKVKVNNREMNQYFFNIKDRYSLLKPAIYKGMCCQMDLNLFIVGGGVKGQADAGSKAFAKALVNCFPELENDFKTLYLTVPDGRRVERKKLNKPKARKSKAYVRR